MFHVVLNAYRAIDGARGRHLHREVVGMKIGGDHAGFVGITAPSSSEGGCWRGRATVRDARVVELHHRPLLIGKHLMLDQQRCQIDDITFALGARDVRRSHR